MREEMKGFLQQLMDRLPKLPYPIQYRVVPNRGSEALHSRYFQQFAFHFEVNGKLSFYYNFRIFVSDDLTFPVLFDDSTTAMFDNPSSCECLTMESLLERIKEVMNSVKKRNHLDSLVDRVKIKDKFENWYRIA